MPFDSNGNFTLGAGYLAVTGQTILPSQHNPPLEDIVLNGLSNTVVRDGRAPMTGALNMGAFKIGNMAQGTLGTDGVNKDQLDTKQVDLGWKPVQVVNVTSAQTSIVLAMPSGAKSLRLSGRIKFSTTIDAAILRISTDGGLNYFQTNGDYTQGGLFVQNSGVTNAPLAVSTFFTMAPGNADVNLASQFGASLDGGSGIPMFRSETAWIGGYRTIFGYCGATISDITHVKITPSASANIMPGTRFIAEAF